MLAINRIILFTRTFDIDTMFFDFLNYYNKE